MTKKPSTSFYAINVKDPENGRVTFAPPLDVEQGKGHSKIKKGQTIYFLAIGDGAMVKISTEDAPMPVPNFEKENEFASYTFDKNQGDVDILIYHKDEDLEEDLPMTEEDSADIPFTVIYDVE